MCKYFVKILTCFPGLLSVLYSYNLPFEFSTNKTYISEKSRYINV